MLSVPLIPWAGALTLTTAGTLTTRRRGQHELQQQWQTLLAGILLVPVAVNLLWLAAMPLIPTVDACLAATMIAAGTPILAAFMIILTRTTVRPHRTHGAASAPEPRRSSALVPA